MSKAYGQLLTPVEERAISEVERLNRAGEAEDSSLLRNRLALTVRQACPPWLVSYQDDIVQAAMIALLRQQKKYEGIKRFPASYLRKAATTAMIDKIRWLRSRGEVPLETAETELTLVEREADPERQCASREIASAIRRCLQKLAQPRQIAVTLHLMGYRVPQIAERTGWKRKQAENLVYRGMQDLRKWLRNEGFEP